MAAQMNHIQLLPRFCVPFAFYFAWSYIGKPNTRHLVSLCLALVWQFYCTIYIGLFTLYLLGALLVAQAALGSRAGLLGQIANAPKKTLVLQATVVLLSVAALLPLVIPYYRVVQEIGVRGWSAIAMLLPRAESCFRAFKGSLLWSWLHVVGAGLPLPWEHEMFPGIVPYAGFLAAACLCLRSRRSSTEWARCVAALGFMTLVIMTISIKGTSVYRVLTFAPGIGALRAITRIVLVLIFLLGLQTGSLVSFIENCLSTRFPRRKKIAILLTASCLIISDQYCTDLVSIGKKEVQQRSARLAEKIEVMNQNKKAQVFYYMLHRSTIIGHPVRQSYAALCIDVSCSSRTWAGVLFP
jgi:hypothetical protein